MAELTRSNRTITLERAGTRLVEHTPPAAPDVRDYPNERAAREIFRKRLVELVNNHWVITRDDADVGPVASWPAMEAKLREHFDPEQLTVYNDFLIDRGDPCGEAAAQSDASPIYETFGCFAEVTEALRTLSGALALQWQHGWIVGVTVRQLDHARSLALLLGAPLARFLSRLEVVTGNPLTLVSALRDSPWRHRIRELVALEHHPARFLPHLLPALERATLSCAIGHPTLRELVLEPSFARDLLGDNFPALEHLVLRCGKIRESTLIELIENAPFEKMKALKRVDLDGEISARTLDRIRDRLAAFVG